MNQSKSIPTEKSPDSTLAFGFRAALTGLTLGVCWTYFFRPGHLDQDLPTTVAAIMALILLSSFWTYFFCHTDAKAKVEAEICTLKEIIQTTDLTNEQLKKNYSLLERHHDEIKEAATELYEKYEDVVAQRDSQAEEIAMERLKELSFERESELEDKIKEHNLAIEALDEEKKQLQLQRESIAEAEQELQIDYEKFEDLQKQVEKLKNEIRGLLNANLRHRTRAVYSEKIKNEFKELIVSSGLKTQAQCTTWERSVANRVKQKIEDKFTQASSNKKG